MAFRITGRAIFAALLLGALPLAAPAAAAHDPPTMNLPAVLAPLLPGVVNLAVWAPADANTPPDANGFRPSRARFFGSGFVIDPNGIIVTNKHVVANAFQITAHFADGSRARAHVMAVAGAVDLAVLKVDVKKPLTALSWGDSDALRIGDPVMTIGNPLGLGMSVSAGIISALNRDIMDTPYDNFIQTDAAINHGNSGGPLVDFKGQVVGIDTSLYTVPNGGSIGLGFAITSNDAKFVVDRLLKYGDVRAGWIGASLQDVSPDVQAALGLSWREGAIVAKLDPASPASQAGLHDGDIIRQIDGQTFTDARALMRDIGKTAAGTTIQLAVWRDGRDMTVPVTVAIYPMDMASAAPTSSAARAYAKQIDLPDFGMTLQSLTDSTRAKYQLHGQKTGVLVGAVQANSEAMQHGINPGDLVLRVQMNAVNTPAEFEQALKSARTEGRNYVLMLVRSGNDQRWIGLVAAPNGTD